MIVSEVLAFVGSIILVFINWFFLKEIFCYCNQEGILCLVIYSLRPGTGLYWKEKRYLALI
jgi:hypothetical protein